MALPAGTHAVAVSQARQWFRLAQWLRSGANLNLDAQLFMSGAPDGTDIRQHTSACVSMRQHTSACVSMRHICKAS